MGSCAYGERKKPVDRTAEVYRAKMLVEYLNGIKRERKPNYER